MQHPRQPEHRAQVRRSSPSPAVAAYPSVKTRYSKCRTAAGRDRTRSRWAGRMGHRCRRWPVWHGDPSGHRGFRDQERRAISPVKSPPAARSVSATCEAGDSAGWQHKTAGSADIGVVEPPWSSARVIQSPAGIKAAAVCLRWRRPLSAQQVGQPTRRGGDQPGPWIVRDAVVRPLGGGGRQRFLDRVLGQVEVSVATHPRGEDMRRQGASSPPPVWACPD